MPEVIEAGSNIETGTGTNTSTFTLPDSPRYLVQSVVATVDNTGGGDALAKVVIRDSSGEVIATNEQGDPIPAGDTGTATFALRLLDKGALGLRFRRINTGAWIIVDATGISPSAVQVGSFFQPWSIGLNGDVVGLGAESTAILSSLGNVFVNADGHIFIEAEGNLQMSGVLGLLEVDNDLTVTAGDDVTITADGGPLTLRCDDQTVKLFNNTIQLQVGSGNDVRVLDSGGNQIFRIDEDGALHGLTGQTLTFDL